MASTTIGKKYERWLKKWAPRLNLGEWEIHIRVVDRAEVDHNDGAIMSSTPDQSYRHCIIRIPKDLQEDEHTNLERAFVHELMHVWVGALDEIAFRIEDALARVRPDQAEVLREERHVAREYLTEQLARIVWNAYEGGR